MEIKVLDKGFVKLVDSMGDDFSIVQMARTSYGGGTKKISEDRSLIRYLMRHKHTTPFEGVIFKFHIKAPIFVFRQWHRHRTWSYNEVSGRYSEMPNEFYTPDETKVTKQNPLNKQGGTDEYIGPKESHLQSFNWCTVFSEEQSKLREYYKEKIDSGMRRELARINLPVSQYSEMYACVDLHNLLHFLKLRISEHAQYEIRVYAQAILDLIKPVVPLTIEAFEDYTLNSISLSALDIKALQQILSTVIIEDTLVDNIFKNKREKEEFIQKYNIINSK